MIAGLRPFQLSACDRVVEAVRHGSRVTILQSPTGSGKSTMGADLVARALARGKRILFIVHRRRLVDQFSDRLNDYHLGHGIIMRGRHLMPGQLCYVASRDTLLADGCEIPPADLVIVDEGRHAASPEFRALLKPFEESGARVILLDATPVGPDGRGLGPWAQAMVIADTTTRLIADGYLVPVKCYAPDRAKRNGQVRTKGVSGDLVASWERYSERLPTVLFTSRVQHSTDAVDEFNRAGIPAAHVDAQTPDDTREAIFQGLKHGQYLVVSNVGIIKEGVDIPCLGCVQFFMDISGRVAFLQGCGRIMRPYPGKSHGVLIDHAGAVFRHGFPDEDTHWSLDGNVDEEYRKHHDDGETPGARYCSQCELLYHDSAECPQCGRLPEKPPRSIFAPNPVDTTNELLTEAERRVATSSNGDRSERIQHWYRCLAVARKRNGTYGMAAQVYRRKYGSWPEESFPSMPERWEWKHRVPARGLRNGAGWGEQF